MKTSNNSPRDVETFFFGEDGFETNVKFDTMQIVMIALAVYVAMYAALMTAKLTKVGS